MTGNLKIATLAALLTGLVLVLLINEIEIGWYPPMWTLAEGRIGYFDATRVRSCIGARALALLADRTSDTHWHHCATTLHQVNALDGFNWRYWALASSGVFTLLSAFGFACGGISLAVLVRTRRATSSDSGALSGGRVLSYKSPATPASMKRSCQRHTQGFDLPVRAIMALVPRPSAVASTISTRPPPCSNYCDPR
jgi:hypothetical protein